MLLRLLVLLLNRLAMVAGLQIIRFLGVLGELRRPTEWEVVLPQLQQIPQLNRLKAPQPALKAPH